MLLGIWPENIWNYTKPYVEEFDVFYVPGKENPLI
jgi:hypothetical protein